MKYLLCVILLTLGCTAQENHTEDSTAKVDESIGSGGPSSQAVQSNQVQLEIVDDTGLEQVLEQNLGKVILVDYWATWCGPCVKQFPHTVELSRRYSAEGLAVVSVCLDEPKNRENVLGFLGRHVVEDDKLENLMSRDGGGSKAMEAFAIESGALPYYKLFDRQGNLSTTFSLDPSAKKQFTPADIEQAVTELLKAE